MSGLLVSFVTPLHHGQQCIKFSCIFFELQKLFCAIVQAAEPLFPMCINEFWAPMTLTPIHLFVLAPLLVRTNLL